MLLASSVATIESGISAGVVVALHASTGIVPVTVVMARCFTLNCADEWPGSPEIVEAAAVAVSAATKIGPSRERVKGRKVFIAASLYAKPSCFPPANNAMNS
jgi:hypothetical protein